MSEKDASGEQHDEVVEQAYRIMVENLGLDEMDLPKGADTLGSPNIPTELQRRVADEVERQRAIEGLVESVQGGAQIKYRLAFEDIRLRELHDVGNNARIMSRRHNLHLIGERFTRSVLQYAQVHDQESADKLEVLREEANKFGFFLFSYSEEHMRNRLTEQYDTGDPRYLIVEAGARHPDPGNKHNKKGLRAADCHIQLPAPCQNTKPVFELPKAGDDVRDEDWVDHIRQHPYRVACIDDIQCMRPMAGLRLASSAMSAGLKQIAHEMNPQRPGFEIEYIVAAIASLQGVQLPDGTEIRLGRDLKVVPIGNGRSQYIFHHFKDDDWAHFNTAYVLKDRRYPIYLSKDPEAKPHYLIVDWYHEVSNLKTKQSPEAVANS